MSLAACLVAATLFSPAASGAEVQSHPIHTPQPEKFPSETLVVIEIESGSRAKYELDKDTGKLFLDRFLSVPQGYPVHYGSICQTLADDGDPLDVLLFTREPILPGVFVKVKPIGVMQMIDGDDQDDKIVAVPTKRVDPTYDKVNEITDLPELDRQRLKVFFETYKLLPEGGKKVTVPGFTDRASAFTALTESRKRFLAKHPKP